MENFSRRNFLKTSSVIAAGVSLSGLAQAVTSNKPLWRYSVAEWSVNPLIFGEAKKLSWDKFIHIVKNDFESIERAAPMKNIDFPKFIRECGCEGAEYVNTLMYNKARNEKYLAELNKVCKGEGITNVLIMVDSEGAVGHPDKAERQKTVENHMKWVDTAVILGCHSIRVNAESEGSFEERQKLVTDGLLMLSEYGEKKGINILVENHGGITSNGKWLSGVMKMVNNKRVGTLPDFGNFKVKSNPDEWYDRYQGVKELMPYAKGVSAKTVQFDDKGEETKSDYHRLMRIVEEAGYHGFVGIEYEGEQFPDRKGGVLATKRLLEKCMTELGKDFK